MIQLELSDSDQALFKALSHKANLLRKAMVRAVKKTHVWLDRQLASAIAKETLVPQKGIKPRVYSDFDAKTLSGRVWVGLNPLSAEKAGRPVKTGSGVRAGRHQFEGAFIASIAGQEGVWKRKGSKRFPVSKQTIDISEPGYEVLDRLEKQAHSYYKKRLSEELNFALNHEA